MSSAYIVRRTNKTSVTYHVKYRLGGRSTRIEHGGAFKRLRDARARANWIRGELAACRDPRLSRLDVTYNDLTLAQAISAMADERVDISRNTELSYRAAAKALPDVRVDDVDVEWVQRWLADAVRHAKPATVATRLSVVRAALDHIGVEPNPARSPRVKTPRVEAPEVRPVTNADWDAIQVKLSGESLLALRLIEAVGLRRSEAVSLAWSDVDLESGRLVVRRGKTRASRRVIELQEWAPHILEQLRDHRSASPDAELVFSVRTPDSLAATFRRACRAAGTNEYGPHALRHRRATIWVNDGVPLRQVAQLLGHTNPSTTLDVYTHVSVD